MRFIQSPIQKLIVLLFCITTAHPVFAEQDEEIHLQNNKNCLPHGANVALSLGGGGFLSTTEMTGFTAGLLSFAMNANKTLIHSESPLHESHLFRGVKSINSISGGSWFASLLIYSEKYRTTTESLARTYVQSPRPDKAIAEVSKVYREGDSFTKLVDMAESTAAKLLGRKLDFVLNLINADISERLKQLLGLLLVVSRNQDKPINWKTFIDDFVLDDIKGIKFKDDVQEWAKGKTWRIIVAAVTPKKSEPDFIYASKKSWNFLKYSMHPEPVYNVQPVLFSAVLGDPEAAACKYDPSSPKNALRLKNVVYEGQDINELFFLDKENTKIKSTGGVDADMLLGMNKARNFSEMPIVGPVSASSAALGVTTETGFLEKIGAQPLAELFGSLEFFDPSIYFAPKANQEDAFDKPTKIMSDIWKSKDPTTERIQELANIGTHELTDGGNVDLNGVATAVATGAKDVFVINVTGGFRKYFSGFINSKTGKPDPNEEVDSIFHQDQTYLNNKLEALHFWAPKDKIKNYKILEGITYGIIPATTKDNDYFGIKKGRNVSLHIFRVKVCFDLTQKCGAKNDRKEPINIGVFDNFDDYAILVAEIVDLMNTETNDMIKNDMLSILHVLKSQSHNTKVASNDEL